MTDFPALQNDLLLRAAKGQPVERSPVWIMRQAGRYLPEQVPFKPMHPASYSTRFRELRSKHGFFEICQTPELACEITLQPIRRYAGLLDASIIFSDILVIPQALGMTVEMLPGSGPHFPEPLKTLQDAEDLLKRRVDVDASLGYVYQAITLTRKELKGQVPLIGFCGAPWTLLAYMIEGGGSKTFSKAKSWLWNHPDMCHRLLQRIADVAAAFLVGQARAGAQLLQVFDSWAGELTPRDFAQFSLPYLSQIATTVKAKLGTDAVPLTVFAKGANHALAALADSGYDVVGLDWTVTPKSARQQTGGKVALQGNADPSILYAEPAAIRREVQAMFQGQDGFGTEGGHIANLGHGITPAVDPENLKCFLQAVHEFSQKKNGGS